jgi:hypothetical protein
MAGGASTTSVLLPVVDDGPRHLTHSLEVVGLRKKASCASRASLQLAIIVMQVGEKDAGDDGWGRRLCGWRLERE